MLVFLCSFQSTSDTNLNLGKENLQLTDTKMKNAKVFKMNKYVTCKWLFCYKNLRNQVYFNLLDYASWKMSNDHETIKQFISFSLRCTRILHYYSYKKRSIFVGYYIFTTPRKQPTSVLWTTELKLKHQNFETTEILMPPYQNVQDIWANI